jgi:hypothetical protein
MDKGTHSAVAGKGVMLNSVSFSSRQGHLVARPDRVRHSSRQGRSERLSLSRQLQQQAGA